MSEVAEPPEIKGQSPFVANINMDFEDIIMKFPDDIPRPQLVELLNIADIRIGGKPATNQMFKSKLVQAAKEKKDVIGGVLGVDIDEYKAYVTKLREEEEEKRQKMEEFVKKHAEPSVPKADTDEEEPAENITDELAADLETLDKLSVLDDIGDMVGLYQVRYIGPRGRISHSNTTTFSGVRYEFYRDTWVDVEEIDFKRMYFPKVRNAIKARKHPHWEVRVMTLSNRFIKFFVEKTKKVLAIKPEVLKDVKHLHEDRIVQLHKYEIKSIHELISTPKERLLEILGLDRGVVTEILEDARRAIQ